MNILKLTSTFVWFVIGVAIAQAFGTVAAAQDAELYDPAPPPNAAFVRVVNATAADLSISAQLAGINFGELAYPGVSAYQVVQEGERVFQSGAKNQSLTIKAGNYYTIAVLGQGEAQQIVPIQDSVSDNPAKCGVLFYNLSDRPSASLRVPSRDVDVIAAVSPGEGKLREVNALDIDLAVVAGEQPVHSFDTVQLKRRTHLSFMLTGAGDDLQVLMAENTTVQ
ncbi:MAG: alginate O-acetyltransferase AlgF [Candidatus Competibacteraceae bacterium]